MTALFDGVAGLLTGTFGTVVEYRRDGRMEWTDIPSTFREQPIEVTDAEGRDVLIIAPTWRVIHRLVPDLKRDDLVRPASGKVYRVVNFDPTGSPAADAQVLCQLEEWYG
ncbi:head-tail joining protein [Ketogulonicigenium vulgare]|uniref:Phage head-tail adaptor n=1 Tax=Ketogulonicigenium vulgare (strain WSH-001) TaxID=759362 RepID=F9Y4L3_KETVW|nr:hypothetical protein [Ketogulonicigenium vulgare]AEM40570.1 hypothetical protein KVU_0731 [Ketogulonicigenium vulgare WSH-001]ALJ80751.1 hypothetical protein KVH_05885 [Ketogulonicigenium vulgare]ANW33546.1 hypothetical protein KvSKV_05855 [Ketogulonicigenium vulgare]AOZ54286.1 hypothetical protein KVC_1269 [Ketogulonicigenium vulgare]